MRSRSRYPTVEKAVDDWLQSWLRFRDKIIKLEVLPVPIEVKFYEEAGKKEIKEAK
jgi:hypothetical protein